MEWKFGGREVSLCDMVVIVREDWGGELVWWYRKGGEWWELRNNVNDYCV